MHEPTLTVTHHTVVVLPPLIREFVMISSHDVICFRLLRYVPDVAYRVLLSTNTVFFSLPIKRLAVV